MQNITAMNARRAHADGAPSLPGQPPVISGSRPRDMQAINDYYFGSHLSVTEVMMRMMERAVGHLNDKLKMGRDGSAEGVASGEAWRERALQKPAKIGSEDDFVIPRPGEGGTTFRDVAHMIQSRFNGDFLAHDKDLRRVLEDMVGFRLDGMSVSDLLQAFTEPGSDAERKVRDAISEGLAGQAGNKVTERMEDAALGPRSIDETLASLKGDGTEEVDEETLAEDLQKIEDAKVLDKLEKTSKTQEAVAEAVKKKRDTSSGDEGAVELALAVIGELAPQVEKTEPEEAENEPSTSEALLSAAESATGDSVPSERVASLAATSGSDRLREAVERAYREASLDDERRDADSGRRTLWI